MAVQGFGAGDFAALAKFAWKIYSNVRESRTNFGKLNLDVECMLVSVGSLDKGQTQELIAEYVEVDDGETRQLEVRALRDGLNSVIMPFYALFTAKSSAFKSPDGNKSLRPINKGGVMMYVDGPTVDAAPQRERPWRRWPVTGWIERLVAAFQLQDLSELRSRFAVQAANLNLFLTRLTHAQLHKQTELLTLKVAEQSLLRDNFRYSLDLAEATRDFRQDVASYVKFLVDGGKPFSDTELQRRKAETRYSDASGRTKHRASGSLYRERERLQALEYSQKESVEFAEEFLGEREVLLDDDARLKLLGARQRLALIELKEDGSGFDSDHASEVLSTGSHKRPAAVVRRKTEPPEQIVPLRRRRDKDLAKTTTEPVVIVCDICDRAIPADKAFYRCSSGRCGGRGDSFDVCKRCYMDGENCPGYDKSICLEMHEVVWKEVD